ncbi:MAG: EF-hand domain-containing protein [Robiginitomaculum sp.]|nr:EF-hand domain-containing protein [Robiginitomaculum sp.]MDQ7077290.1 EF-hand domain-containing protein [Robiginitomaculum sp.]
MKRILLTALMTTALAGTSALASPNHSTAPKGPMGPHGGPQVMFDLMDTNKDGVVTQDEAAAHRAKIFDKLDRNDDGYLENAEERLGRFKRHARKKIHRAERKADRQLALDTNKDGKVSLKEFEAKSSPLFEKLDRNGDGTITPQEHKAAKREMFARLDVNGDGFLSAEDKMLSHEKKRHTMQYGLAPLDTDKDGRISRDEFVKTNSPMFMRFDQNGDGKITREEIENAPPPPMGIPGRP